MFVMDVSRCHFSAIVFIRKLRLLLCTRARVCVCNLFDFVLVINVSQFIRFLNKVFLAPLPRFIFDYLLLSFFHFELLLLSRRSFHFFFSFSCFTLLLLLIYRQHSFPFPSFAFVFLRNPFLLSPSVLPLCSVHVLGPCNEKPAKITE